MSSCKQLAERLCEKAFGKGCFKIWRGEDNSLRMMIAMTPDVLDECAQYSRSLYGLTSSQCVVWRFSNSYEDLLFGCKGHFGLLKALHGGYSGNGWFPAYACGRAEFQLIEHLRSCLEKMPYAESLEELELKLAVMGD